MWCVSVERRKYNDTHLTMVVDVKGETGWSDEERKGVVVVPLSSAVADVDV